MTRDPGRVKMIGLRLGMVRSDLRRKPGMARDDEEEALPRKRAWLEKLTLDMLGIEELRDYIAALRDEIVRVEAEIARKSSHRDAAETFFRKS
jgi:uncharacterized small protein (DUF1192 family)